MCVTGNICVPNASIHALLLLMVYHFVNRRNIKTDIRVKLPPCRK